MKHIPVDRADDPRLVPYTGLTDESMRRRREAPGGDLDSLFICEGAVVTMRALEAGYTVESILVAEDMLRRLPELPDDVPVFVGSPETVETVIGFRFHRGFVAAFRRPPPLEADELLTGTTRILVCENMTNPTNLGVTMRSAAALGFDGLLLDPTSCDPLYRRAIRVSMGTVFSLPYARLEALPGGLPILRSHGFRTVGLSPQGDSPKIGDIDRSGRIALVLGAEGPGLSTATAAALDQLTHIPMADGIDSLNVGAAAAIAAYVFGEMG